MELAQRSREKCFELLRQISGADRPHRATHRLPRPSSFIWSFEREGSTGLVVGLANNGVAGVPGVLRLTVFSEDGAVHVSGCVDPGYPKPSGIRQAMLMLPQGTAWSGLRLKAELEVKGVRYPVNWACRQKTNEIGR